MNETLKIVSFNLRHDTVLSRINRWNTRREIVTDVILNSNASVIGVQEMTPAMKQDMVSTLKDYRIYGSGRSRLREGEYSAVILKNENFEVRYYDTFWLSKNPEVSGSRALLSPFPRICTVCEADCKIWGRPIRIFNTHFCHLSPFARNLSVHVITEYMHKLNQKEKMPAILMGDMNTGPHSRPIRFLTENLHGFSDIHLSSVFSEEWGTEMHGTYHGFKGGSNGRTLDYIFVTDEIKVIKAYADTSSIEGKYPSDHFPLTAELRLKD